MRKYEKKKDDEESLILDFWFFSFEHNEHNASPAINEFVILIKQKYEKSVASQFSLVRKLIIFV